MDIKLNKQQAKAARHKDGPLLILAGAGTGKTATVIKRIETLIKEYHVKPYNILAITFTNKASQEMGERIAKLLETNDHHLNISTIHSLAFRILRNEVECSNLEKNFSIITPRDTYNLLKNIIEKNIDPKENELDNKDIYKLLNTISNLKSELITPDIYKLIIKNQEIPPYIDLEKSLKMIEEIDDFLKAHIYNVYNSYEKLLQRNNCIDFDGLLTQATYLLMDNNKVLGKYQEKYKYIIIDEYQDTNHAQYILVRLLAAKYENLTVVGDEKQSIYKFRNADYRNILNFEDDYKKTKIIKLETNYRSYQPILDTANKLIKNNSNQKNVTLHAHRNGGENPFITEVEDPFAEANLIIEKINEFLKKGYTYSDIAILFRVKAQSAPVEDVFIKNGIPYIVYGGLNFYERKEIKTMTMYLNFLNNKNNDFYLNSIINMPPRGIGKKTIQELNKIAEKEDVSLWEACNNVMENGNLNTRKTRVINNFIEIIDNLDKEKEKLKIGEFTSVIAIESGLIKYYEEKGTDNAQNRLENIDQFTQTAWYYQSEKDITYDDFLLVIALQQNNKEENDQNKVNLMTIHGSKGLEFPVVFLIGMEEGLLPYYRAVISDDIEEIEEERRLCYVGMTRAEDYLLMTHCNERVLYGNVNNNDVSRFLSEIGYKPKKDKFNRRGVMPW